MKLKALAIAGLVAGCTAIAIPASAADKETRQMMADIRMLQEQSQQVQTLIGQLTDALKNLDTRLGARIDDQTNTTRKSLADEKLVVDTVSNELRVLREKVDDNNVRFGTLTQEVDALRQLVTQIGSARASLAPPDDTSTSAPLSQDAAGSTPAAPPIAGASPSKIFGDALNDYYGGDYKLAVAGFQMYINSFPHAEQAAEAQFNIGQSYLNDGKYQQAVDAFDTMIQTYPGSNRTADSYYKKGVALQTLGQGPQALDAFQTVISKYPDTDAARLAQQRIPELKK